MYGECTRAWYRGVWGTERHSINHSHPVMRLSDASRASRASSRANPSTFGARPKSSTLFLSKRIPSDSVQVSRTKKGKKKKNTQESGISRLSSRKGLSVGNDREGEERREPYQPLRASNYEYIHFCLSTLRFSLRHSGIPPLHTPPEPH